MVNTIIQQDIILNKYSETKIILINFNFSVLKPGPRVILKNYLFHIIKLLLKIFLNFKEYRRRVKFYLNNISVPFLTRVIQ